MTTLETGTTRTGADLPAPDGPQWEHATRFVTRLAELDPRMLASLRYEAAHRLRYDPAPPADVMGRLRWLRLHMTVRVADRLRGARDHICFYDVTGCCSHDGPCLYEGGVIARAVDEMVDEFERLRDGTAVGYDGHRRRVRSIDGCYDLLAEADDHGRFAGTVVHIDSGSRQKVPSIVVATLQDAGHRVRFADLDMHRFPRRKTVGAPVVVFAWDTYPGTDVDLDTVAARAGTEGGFVVLLG